MPRRAVRASWAGLLALACAASGAWAQAPEYAIKAAYLYKLGPFITWSGAAWPSREAPAALCLQGDDPFGTVLDRAVAGQKIDGRPVVVRRLPAIGRGSGCHILYAAGGREQSVRDALNAVRGEPMLTVTDAARGQEAGGVVHFVVAGNKVKLEIDAAAARTQQLQVSSKLMALAVRVHP